MTLKQSVAILLALVNSLAVCVAADESNAEKPGPIKLALELSDGSRIIGLPEAGTIPFATQYGKMDIALKLVTSISFSDDHETVTVLFQNGDKLEGALSVKEIKLTTLFGEHSIPVKHIVSIKIVAGGSLDASLRKGLVLYYSFDRDEKDKVTDKSGQKNHGKVNGPKWTIKGKVSGAYEFDGIDDYIEVAHSKHLDFDAASDSFTVAVWVKIGVLGKPLAFVSKRTGGYIPNPYYTMMNPDNTMWAGSWDGRTGTGGSGASSPNAVKADKWYHVVAVFSANTVKLHLDGALDCSGRPEGGKNSQGILIGKDSPVGSHFNGTIDEVMIFNRALSENEIKKLYNSQK